MSVPHPRNYSYNREDILKNPVWYKVDTWRSGYFVAWSTMYEELPNGIGQYPVAIVIDHETKKADYVPVNNVSFYSFQP